MEMFSDIQDWPGKKPPSNRGKLPADPEPQGWDSKPLKFNFGGVETEFFTISNLATALNKSVVTIRSWENKGLMPKTPYRSPRPRGEMLPGTKPVGKRLWTRDQILGILQIAADERVILNGKPPTKQFHDKVLALYKKLLSSN